MNEYLNMSMENLKESSLNYGLQSEISVWSKYNKNEVLNKPVPFYPMKSMSLKE